MKLVNGAILSKINISPNKKTSYTEYVKKRENLVHLCKNRLEDPFLKVKKAVNVTVSVTLKDGTEDNDSVEANEEEGDNEDNGYYNKTKKLKNKAHFDNG